MKIKYSPCKSDKDTEIIAISENKIIIDGKEFEFDIESVVWPNIMQTTDGKILDVYRENGELYITVLRFYISDLSWDTGDYHAFNW